MFHASWARRSLWVCLAAAVASATSSNITAAEPTKRGALSAVGGAFGRAIGILPELEWKERAPPAVTNEQRDQAEVAYEQFSELRNDLLDEQSQSSGGALRVPKVRGLNPGRDLDRLHFQAVAPPLPVERNPFVSYPPEQPLLPNDHKEPSGAALELPAMRAMRPGKALDHLVVGAVAPPTVMYSRKSFIAGGAELPPEFRALARKVDERAADLEDEGEYDQADRLREMARMLRELGREAEQVVTKPPVPQFFSTP